MKIQPLFSLNKCTLYCYKPLVNFYISENFYSDFFFFLLVFPLFLCKIGVSDIFSQWFLLTHPTMHFYGTRSTKSWNFILESYIFCYGLNFSILSCFLLVYIELQIMGKLKKLTLNWSFNFWLKYLGHSNNGTKSSHDTEKQVITG